MSAYMQHKTGTVEHMVEKIVGLYAKYDALVEAGESKRKIGAASAQITKARYNHYEVIRNGMWKEAGNPDHDARMVIFDKASKIAAGQVGDALAAAGRKDGTY